MQRVVAVAAGLLVTTSLAVGGADTFVNWESPHGTPLDLTPDGSTLLAVNTADNRLEVLSVSGSSLASIGSVPVGLDPVSVRARSDDEAWVVNHVSDTVSIVDLTTLNVVHTLYPGDEPVDVVFAAGRAFVSVSQLNQVVAYDLPGFAATVIEIEGEDPRTLATDGTSVYAAIFESGNDTTILAQTVVSSNINPYPGDANPPPNDGTGFTPPIGAGAADPPEVSLIVKKDPAGDWLDDNATDWSSAVSWDLHDHDVAIINASSLAVSYATGLMNLNMAMGVRSDGGVTVVGTDAINEIRFEPNVKGIFVRVMGATITGSGAGTAIDLNPHLDYSTPTADQSVRDQSIGDPRGIAWTPGDNQALITGMGSNNVVVVDGALGRTGLIEVGEGPTGIVMDANGDWAYVSNKFEGSISIIDVNGLSESSRVSYYDPTPAEISGGRPFLYDTHRTSGLGQSSCASCHIDGRMDQVAWDLGDPQGEVKPFNQICNGNIFPNCEDWHPMKGPMTTQTLIGIIGTEPFHWRGDREDLAAFNGAFESLLGDDTQLTSGEMDQFVAFVSRLTTMPNPFRDLNNTLPASFSNGGNAQTGEDLFLTGGLDGVNCVTCHALPTGTNGQLTSANLLQETQSIKIPQLRNMHEKTGFEDGDMSNNRGFGFIHDGSVHTMFDFLNFGGFQFANDQERLDVEAFMMSFSTDTHAGVGAQAMLPEPAGAGQPATVSELIAAAAEAEVGLVVKGVVSGEQRGYYLDGNGQYQSDRAAETLNESSLFALAGPGSELTFTLVPAISAQRIGVDRDEDTFFDRDELDAGSDPADPGSTPDNVVPGDVDGDGIVGITDFLAVLGNWGSCPQPCPPSCPADQDDDCEVGINDFLIVLGNWTS